MSSHPLISSLLHFFNFRHCPTTKATYATLISANRPVFLGKLAWFLGMFGKTMISGFVLRRHNDFTTTSNHQHTFNFTYILEIKFNIQSKAKKQEFWVDRKENNIEPLFCT